MKRIRHICASAISDSRGRSYPLGGQAELAEARAKNPATVAWLYIPGAEVDDPVMQVEDNGYYLKLDENTTIFGHSTSNCDPDGVRFTKL